MNRKGQYVVLRELLAFLMGVIIMLTVVSIFNDYINPQIKEFSVNEQSYSMLYHFDSMLKDFDELARSVNNQGLSVNYDLPSEVGEQEYRLYSTNGAICIRTRGDVSLIRCVNSTINVSGNYLSGAQIKLSASMVNGSPKITFDEYVPIGAVSYFYQLCGDGVVVNWDGNQYFFSGDTMTCGCDSLQSGNLVSDPGFESLNSWDPAVIGPSSIAYLNDTPAIVYNGSYSLYTETTGGTPNDASLYGQTVDTVGYLSFHVNGSLAGLPAGYYGLAVVASGTIGNGKSIYYLGNYTGLPFACDSFADTNVFLKCLNLDDDEWHHVEVNPLEDFDTYYGTYDDSYFNIYFGVQFNGRAYFDDVEVGITPEGEYCDVNNDGVAEGVCYSGSCQKSYLDNFDSTSYFNDENAFISATFRNYNSSATCSLTLDGSDYDMTLNNTHAYYNVGVLSRGDHPATINCSSDNFFTRSYNLTSGVLKPYASYDLGLRDVNFAMWGHTVGEINSSSEGKEILITGSTDPSEEFSTFVFSQNGERLFTLNKTNLLSTNVTEDALITDLNGDEVSDLLLDDGYYLYCFNDLVEQWVYDHSSSISYGGGGGLAVADINESSGKEVLFVTNKLTVFSASGSELWSYDDDFQHVVVDDITPSNSGLEILLSDNYYGSGDSKLQMLDTAGNELYSYTNNNHLQCVWSGLTPAVGELNSSYDGKEVVWFMNSTSDDEELLTVFNSSLHPIWTYSFNIGNCQYQQSGTVPSALAIGDLTGDGFNEIVFTTYVTGGVNINNDHLYIFNRTGVLITDYVSNFTIDQWRQAVLAEVDSTNDGLEILVPENEMLRVIDYQGNQLYNSSTDAANTLVITDIDEDGFDEVIGLEDVVTIWDTGETTGSNDWLFFNRNENKTGFR